MDEHWRARDHVSWTRVPLSKQKHLTTIFESVVDGGRTRGRERETERVPPFEPPLLDSSPALDCSIATTRGMLSTTATKCAEEIPLCSPTPSPSRLSPSPPTDGPALFTAALARSNHDTTTSTD